MCDAETHDILVAVCGDAMATLGAFVAVVKHKYWCLNIGTAAGFAGEVALFLG